MRLCRLLLLLSALHATAPPAAASSATSQSFFMPGFSGGGVTLVANVPLVPTDEPERVKWTEVDRALGACWPTKAGFG